MERVARSGSLGAIKVAVGPSLVPGAALKGASAASGVLAGSRTEAGEEGRRSQVEALVEEGVLSYLQEQVELRLRHLKTHNVNYCISSSQSVFF